MVDVQPTCGDLAQFRYDAWMSFHEWKAPDPWTASGEPPLLARRSVLPLQQWLPRVLAVPVRESVARPSMLH